MTGTRGPFLVVDSHPFVSHDLTSFFLKHVYFLLWCLCTVFWLDGLALLCPKSDVENPICVASVQYCWIFFSVNVFVMMFVGLRKEGYELVGEHRLLNDVLPPTLQSVDKHYKCKKINKNTIKTKLIKISLDLY